MALSIASNSSALMAGHRLADTSRSMNGTLERISSGLRITSASADAAGSAVASNLETKDISLRQAMRNTMDAISILETVDSAADEMSDIVMRVHEIFTASASETLDDDERDYLVDEYTQLRDELDRISSDLEFNGISLNNSSFDAQVGANSNGDNQITLEIGDLSPDSGLTLPGTLLLQTAAGAQSVLSGAVKSLDLATDSINEVRSTVGATMNRLDSALSHNQTYTLALESAQASIQDADYALETAELSKLQIMQQAGIASLTQAKNMNQSVIGLL